MGDIICTVPEACDDKDCPAAWHLSHYWVYDDGTYSVCDSDGNHDPCDEDDVPSWEQVEAAWLEYSRHVAATGCDPLGEFMVARTTKRKERYTAAFRKGIAGPVLIKLTRGGKSVPVHEIPGRVAEFLMIKRTNNPNCNTFDGDWETLAACDGVKVYRGVARITFTIEHGEPRGDAAVSADLRRAARRHLRETNIVLQRLNK